jgi:hypothetical protein
MNRDSAPTIVIAFGIWPRVDGCAPPLRLCADHEKARVLRIAMTKMIDQHLARTNLRQVDGPPRD